MPRADQGQAGGAVAIGRGGGLMKTTPPCVGKWFLFDSTDPNDHRDARLLCAACPEILPCSQLLADVKAEAGQSGGPVGTWAGQLLRVKGGREVRNAETLAAEDAAYSID